MTEDDLRYLPKPAVVIGRHFSVNAWIVPRGWIQGMDGAEPALLEGCGVCDPVSGLVVNQITDTHVVLTPWHEYVDVIWNSGG
jgi:hypothetical protein